MRAFAQGRALRLRPALIIEVCKNAIGFRRFRCCAVYSTYRASGQWPSCCRNAVFSRGVGRALHRLRGSACGKYWPTAGKKLALTNAVGAVLPVLAKNCRAGGRMRQWPATVGGIFLPQTRKVLKILENKNWHGFRLKAPGKRPSWHGGGNDRPTVYQSGAVAK